LSSRSRILTNRVRKVATPVAASEKRFLAALSGRHFGHWRLARSRRHRTLGHRQCRAMLML